MAIKPNFSVMTYNVLAKEFADKNTDLSPNQLSYAKTSRVNDLVARMLRTQPDIVCLQEVSKNDLQDFRDRMFQNGYACEAELFDGKADGIATFYKRSVVNLRNKKVVPYNDGTGRKALGIDVSVGGTSFTVWNTHIVGGKDNYTKALAQIDTLFLNARHPSIVCMDGNFTPSNTDKFAKASSAGFTDALNGQNSLTSVNGKSHLRLDYIFHSGNFFQFSSSAVGSTQQYLTQQEPSDHVPVEARYILPTASAPNPSQQGSFKGKILNNYLQKGQYANYAMQFQGMLNGADVPSGTPHFVSNLHAMVNTIQDSNARDFFNGVCSEMISSWPKAVTGPKNPYPNGYFRHTIFQHYLQKGQYAQHAQEFERMLNAASPSPENPHFIRDLHKEVQKVQDPQARAFFNTVCGETINTWPTVIALDSSEQPFILGTGPGMSWERGIPMQKNADGKWEYRVIGKFNEFDYKIRLKDQIWEVLDNDPMKNRKASQWMSEEIRPSFG